MSLREDFRDISYEMARIAKVEMEKIEERIKKAITFIEENIDQQIEKDTLKMELEFIQEKQAELNIDESERVSQINQAIAEKKARCIKDFTDLLKLEVRKRIEEKKEKYFQFIFQNICKFLPVINQPVKIAFSEQDLEYMKKKALIKMLPEKAAFFHYDDRFLTETCGFKIYSKEREFIIDFSFETLLDRHYHEIKMRFMKIFPLFEINVQNAMEIDRIKHGKAKRYET